MDAKEKQCLQDRADGLVHDWVFRRDRREEVVRAIAASGPPLRVALLVALMGRRLAQADMTELAAEIAAVL